MTKGCNDLGSTSKDQRVAVAVFRGVLLRPRRRGVAQKWRQALEVGGVALKYTAGLDFGGSNPTRGANTRGSV